MTGHPSEPTHAPRPTEPAPAHAAFAAEQARDKGDRRSRRIRQALARAEVVEGELRDMIAEDEARAVLARQKKA